MEFSCEELDKVVFYLKNTPETLFRLNKSQVEKVKAAWPILQFFDTENDYTFSEDFRTLRKDKIEIFKKVIKSNNK